MDLLYDANDRAFDGSAETRMQEYFAATTFVTKQFEAYNEMLKNISLKNARNSFLKSCLDMQPSLENYQPWGKQPRYGPYGVLLTIVRNIQILRETGKVSVSSKYSSLEKPIEEVLTKELKENKRTPLDQLASDILSKLTLPYNYFADVVQECQTFMRAQSAMENNATKMKKLLEECSRLRESVIDEIRKNDDDEFYDDDNDPVQNLDMMFDRTQVDNLHTICHVATVGDDFVKSNMLDFNVNLAVKEAFADDDCKTSTCLVERRKRKRKR